VKQRCVTCAFEKLAANCVYCYLLGEVILLEDRLKPNDCPDYKRIAAGADKMPELSGREEKEEVG
jgi:hypothetical protein